VPGTYRFSLVATDIASQQSTSDEVIVNVARQLPPHVTSYVYDGDGNRVSQTNDGTVTSYVVDTLPANDRVLSATTGTSTTYFIYGKDLLYSLDAVGPHYHHADSLGSTIAVTDSTGAVESSYGYDIFGAIRNMTGTAGTKFTFTGEQNDDAGIEYLRARYYDTSTGRFMSRDPFPMQASDTQTVNRYAYVSNNPTNHIDPSGKCPFCLDLVLGFIDLLPAEAQVVILGTSAAAANAGAHFWGADELVDGEAEVESSAPASRVVPKGFDGSGEEFIDHTYKHSEDFGFSGPNEFTSYNNASVDFFDRPSDGLMEKVRFNGDVVRWDPVSNAFGVMRADGATRTYYVLDAYWLHLNGYDSYQAYYDAQ
jgi:RHS repeat-associated protein